MEQRIEIKNLHKNFGSTQILKDISFEAKPGRITTFLGPNGAGKSSNFGYYWDWIKPVAAQLKSEGKIIPI